MSDATFEDGGYADRPLRLAVETPDDLTVVSALIQDAVGLTGEISWMPKRRRFVALVNRFRWEDRQAATRQGRGFERVRSALVVDGVRRVQAMGLDPKEPETVYSLLSAGFSAGEPPAGTITLILAGDGELALEVEGLDLRLIDLTKPWAAPSGSAPDHDPE